MKTKAIMFIKAYGRGMSLFAMMVLGAFFPRAQGLSSYIEYLLMAMLFFAFLDMRVSLKSFPLSIVLILLANNAIALLGFGVFSANDFTLALAAFVTGIAPAAIASPVVIGFLEGRVEYVLAVVLLTNLSSAVIVPLLLPVLVGRVVPISTWQVLQPTLMVMFVPLLMAVLVGRMPSRVQSAIRTGKQLSFLLWLSALFIISAKASDFIRNENPGSPLILVQIALISLVICVTGFSIGTLIGGHRYRREASQALGQKNLAFVIWISLTFLNPLVAMGPTFYVVYQNLYNSWQIYRYEKRRNVE